MKITSKISYDNFIDKLFLVYICFFYAFPYQILKIELLLLVLLLLNLRKIKLSLFLGWSIMYISVLLFSTLYSVDPTQSLVKSLQILKNLIFANALINYMNSVEKVENIFKYFIMAGIILCIRILLIFPFDKLGISRLEIIDLFNANDLALKWCISLIFLLYFIFIKNKKNFLNIVLVFLFYIIITFTGSRKGFLFENVAILFVWLLKIKNKIKFFFLLFIILTLTMFFYKDIISIPIIYNILGIRIEGLISSISKKGEIDSSTIIRINMINDGIDYLIKRPLLGYGVDNYRVISQYKTYSHNNYIELLTGIGFLGTIVYYFIYFYNLIYSFKFLKKGKHIFISNCILTVMFLILELGLVTYDSRCSTFILALLFSIINIFKNKV